MNKKKTTDKSIGKTIEELGYDGLPQVLKDEHTRIAKERGWKGGGRTFYKYLKKLQNPLR